MEKLIERDAALAANSRTNLALGIAAVVLAVVLIVELAVNHGVQAQIADNAKLLAKNEEVAKVDRALVQLLAKSAFESHDADITSLLARNGVTFKEKPAAPAPAALPSASGAQ